MRGKQTVLTSAGQGPIEVGYARVSAGPGINGTAILRGIDLPSGIALFEAGVPPASLYRDFSVVLDSEGIYDTGVALLSPPLIQRPNIFQAVPATVVIRLYDDDYSPLAEETFRLKRGEYRPRFVHELFSDPTVSSTAREMRGILTIQSDQELATLTLRQGHDPAKSFPGNVSTLTVFPVIPGRPEIP